jgi:hypothetical protein
MAVTQPPEITAPPVAPQRKDRNTFADRVDAFLTWMIAAVAQFMALAANVWANATEAYNASLQAVASATIASAAANTATLTANALPFNAATNYTQGQSAISLQNFVVYRRKSAGSSATDPAADAANWQRALAEPFGAVDALSITGDTALTLTARNVLRVSSTMKNSSLRLPAANTIVNGNGTYMVKNVGAFALPVRDSSGVLLAVLPGGGGCGVFACEDFSTASGLWLVIAPENIGSIATGGATIWATSACIWIGVSAIPGAIDKALICWAGGGYMYAAIATRSAAGSVSIGGVATIGACDLASGAMCIALSSTAGFVTLPYSAGPSHTLYALALNVATNAVSTAGSKALYGNYGLPNGAFDPQVQAIDAARAAWVYSSSTALALIVAQHNGAAAPTFSETSLAATLSNYPSICLAHVGGGNLLLAGSSGATLYSTTGVATASLGTRSWTGQSVMEGNSNAAGSRMFSQGGNRAAVVTGGAANGVRERTFTLASSGAAPSLPSGHRHFPSGTSSNGVANFTGALIGSTYCTIGMTTGGRANGLRLMRYANDALYEFAYGWPDDMPITGSAGLSWSAAGVNGQNAIAVSLDFSNYPQVAALEVCKA